jgi:hypothetical protein
MLSATSQMTLLYRLLQGVQALAIRVGSFDHRSTNKAMNEDPPAKCF